MVCIICGGPTKKPNLMYCGRRCSNASRSVRERENPVIVKCAICNKQYGIHPSSARKKRVHICSNACVAIYTAAKRGKTLELRTKSNCPMPIYDAIEFAKYTYKDTLHFFDRICNSTPSNELNEVLKKAYPRLLTEIGVCDEDLYYVLLYASHNN